MQALSQHIVELEKNIEVMKEELVCANVSIPFLEYDLYLSLGEQLTLYE